LVARFSARCSMLDCCATDRILISWAPTIDKRWDNDQMLSKRREFNILANS